ncbi:hypothetical protein AQ779_23530 [Burkholderia pseudomallei]|nr:hypothetical protein AQ853_28935 [Burkholderia pseudomallei]OMU42837.1 hypothetical protein AQ776_16040 [Burkholderia pseudomallei]OMU74667.1 hypothetical protein AQ779_23530 [Burkholderia pseudomallei]OMV08001.1 hypothetical protein AQ786_23530 [Burkholderia pseudomallei]OMV28054.1 hypothetical protein AQ789_20660 [Burkholderia pseudomallei]
MRAFATGRFPLLFQFCRGKSWTARHSPIRVVPFVHAGSDIRTVGTDFNTIRVGLVRDERAARVPLLVRSVELTVYVGCPEGDLLAVRGVVDDFAFIFPVDEPCALYDRTGIRIERFLSSRGDAIVPREGVDEFVVGPAVHLFGTVELAVVECRLEQRTIALTARQLERTVESAMFKRRLYAHDIRLRRFADRRAIRLAVVDLNITQCAGEQSFGTRRAKERLRVAFISGQAIGDGNACEFAGKLKSRLLDKQRAIRDVRELPGKRFVGAPVVDFAVHHVSVSIVEHFAFASGENDSRNRDSRERRAAALSVGIFHELGRKIELIESQQRMSMRAKRPSNAGKKADRRTGRQRCSGLIRGLCRSMRVIDWMGQRCAGR